MQKIQGHSASDFFAPAKNVVLLACFLGKRRSFKGELLHCLLALLSDGVFYESDIGKTIYPFKHNLYGDLRSPAFPGDYFYCQGKHADFPRSQFL